MKKILIIEDCHSNSFLIAQIIGVSKLEVEIKYATNQEEALALIEWADLIISDFTFPITGFLGVLPTIQKAQRPFVLHSAEPEHVKIYDHKLQIAAIPKGANFVQTLLGVLKNI